MMIINKPSAPDHHTQNAPFLFRKRVEKIDWRRLAAVDVNRVASQIDIDTLQEILTSVAFCDITSEIDTRYVDTNFIKLFQLAQLLVEYLLYSQDYLTTSMNALKEENEGLKKNIAQLQEQLVEKSNRLTQVRRECHRRRLLLLAQQQLMDSGPQSYHRCAYCPKAFLNASFLAAHVHRRHPETEVSKPAEPGMGTVETSVNQQPQFQHPNLIDIVQTQNNNTSTSLEREVRELLEQLKSSTQQSPINALMFMKPQEGNIEQMERQTADEDPAKPDWQTVLIEEHRRDMELLRNTFEKELRAIQAQHAATQDELMQLKVKRAASNLGELMDDVPPLKTNNIVPIQIRERSPTKESVQRERVISVGASVRSNVTGSSIPLGGQIIPVYDEPTPNASKTSLQTENRSSSEHISRISRGSHGFTRTASASEARTVSVKRDLSQLSNSPLRGIDKVAETDDTMDESDGEQVSRKLSKVLTTSGASSPATSIDSTNVLRYSRLLDQLRADPETLRGLRHEVEQLLAEQLSERGIQADQTRITTTQLNERLIVLRREREHLARKHVNFLEIREALAQHVDRLANAMLHGKSVQHISASDVRTSSGRIQRASLIARSGLPPPAMHSPSSVRKAGTLPAVAKRGANLASPLGSSMPTLSRYDQHAGGVKAHRTQLNAPRPHFQNSSPQLQFNENFDEINSSRSALSNQSPIQYDRDEPTEFSHVQLGAASHSPSPRKARRSPQRSRKTTSPLKVTTSPSSVLLKSPTVQFSHDQRVMTFDQRETNLPATAASSTDEWDSEPDEEEQEEEEKRQGSVLATRPPTSNAPQLASKRSLKEAPDVIGSGVDLDEADRFLNELGQNQMNTNFPYMDNYSATAPSHMVLNRAHSVRTDDEDICSVSSINGGAAEDSSFSLLPGTPTKCGTKPGSVVSRSFDPHVAAAQAHAAALGPRPNTRFGSSSRHSFTVAGATPGSMGSPDSSQTIGTSLWLTNSKAASLSTNLNAGLKSDNADEDFDTDD